MVDLYIVQTWGGKGHFRYIIEEKKKKKTQGGMKACLWRHMCHVGHTASLGTAPSASARSYTASSRHQAPVNGVPAAP